MTAQSSLFPDDEVAGVSGFRVAEEAIDAACEAELCARIDALPLAPFRFGQWLGKRLTANFGSGYDYARGAVTDAPPLPDWLLAVRASVAGALGRDPARFIQALAIRYDPGAGIGWHRDRPQYGEVIGLSLSAPAVLRLRRRVEGGFERRSVSIPPRSAYLLSGEVREGWEHSIAPLDETRRSLTFRTLRNQGAMTP